MHTYRCPACGGIHQLIVVVEMSANLRQDESGELETEDAGLGHCWNNESTMTCGECTYVSTAAEFLNTTEEDD